MIDYIALLIGHGLLAIAFLRLVMRDALDVDPALDRFRQSEQERRQRRQRERRRVRSGKSGDDPGSTAAQTGDQDDALAKGQAR